MWRQERILHACRTSTSAFRIAAFEWLDHQRQLHGETLRRNLLIEGFSFEGRRVPLILSQQGIHKPAVLNLPLSTLTSPPSERKPRPYDDAVSPDGLLLYRYRGTDIAHRDNVGLREAMKLQVPLVYFHGIVPGRYIASWPVYIVGDDPSTLTFTIAVDDRQYCVPAASAWGSRSRPSPALCDAPSSPVVAPAGVS